MKPSPATILVVDDDPKNRKLLVTLLGAQGYRTTTASSGEEALVAVTEEPPDLILLDVMMPGTDGYQVAAALKADPATASIPIIMVSALADREARVSGLNAGAEEFLTKPVDKAELWLRVRNLLRLKDLSDRLQGQSVFLEQQVQARTADLHQLAHYDALTCVPNRAYLHATLQKTLPIASSRGWAVAVMFIDIDHFKSVNDTRGHAVGDTLLAQFSGRLVESVRVRDTVGRLGGDEFALVVLLEGEQRDAAEIVAAKVHQALQSPFDLNGEPACVSASIGIAVFPEDGVEADTLLRNADTAMYRAKAAGRNTWRFFDAGLDEGVAAWAEGEAAARRVTDSSGALALGLLDDMHAPTCAVDVTGRITAVNRAWRDVESDAAAVPAHVAVGASYWDLLAAHHGGDPSAFSGGIRDVLSGASDRFELGYSPASAGPERRFRLVAFRLPHGAGAVISHLDTAPAGSVTDLTPTGSHDGLTGLPNRDLLLARLRETLAARQVDGAQVATACVAIDGFKNINEGYGYAAGDDLLRAISGRVSEVLRGEDMLARLAGDEFVAVWPGVWTQREATELAQRLAATFATPYEIGGGPLTVSASVGVALATPTQSAEDLLLAADAAMRAAKRQGPGRTSVYTSQVQQGAHSRIQVESEIRTGLARGEFVLHYQPVVDLQAREVTGVEALVRWNHPDGMRLPDAFIPVAERSGLVVPLGAWVLGEACRQATRWSEIGLDLTMGVNLSARQVADPGLMEIVSSALLNASLPAERLLVEITESAVIEDAELALAALQSLDELGVGLAIDDFGTGYSSLLYLKRYPVHTLKIDRAFVAGMGLHADDDAIVASVVSLAAAVNAQCTAEGVETHYQAAALRDLGCHSAQGYLFARPMAADEIPAAIRRCEDELRLPLLMPRTGGSRSETVLPAVLARIHELQLAGASVHTIAAALNGYAGSRPSGARWTSHAVARVLLASATHDSDRDAALDQGCVDQPAAEQRPGGSA